MAEVENLERKSNEQPYFRYDHIQKATWQEKIFLLLSVAIIIICPITIIICLRVVKQYKRAVIMRFGRIRSDSPAGPGVIFLLPCTDNVIFIDLRTQSLKVHPQEVLTKDLVTVTVGAVIYFHVSNPINCVLNVQGYQAATEYLAQAILKSVMGEFTLTDLLTTRNSISQAAKSEIFKETSDWGIVIERVEIKDIKLPQELQTAMAAEAEGTRVAKANMIDAEGEIEIAESLREASKVMMENPETLQLRYLQSLNTMTLHRNTSILFPFPIDIPEPHGWHWQAK